MHRYIVESLAYLGVRNSRDIFLFYDHYFKRTKRSSIKSIGTSRIGKPSQYSYKEHKDFIDHDQLI